MITGDGAYIKKINRGLILSKIIEHKAVSRADLSKITGLNKATISVQVADLLNDHLIYETQQEHNVVGRRPILLSINRSAGYVLGIDLDYKYIQYTVSDLGGHPVDFHAVELETENYHDILKILIDQIKAYQEKWSASTYGLISVTIGIHGTVNNDERINFVPTYQWQNIGLKEDLNKELDIEISIQNNANLSAYAERVYQYHESNNLLCIMLFSGIGVGIMIDRKLHKGFHGYAGEMGHMIIRQDGDACNCGNRGCWELYSSEKSLLKKLKKHLHRTPLSYDDIRQLIEEQDPTTLEILEEYIIDLSTGLNNIINMYNPETLVLTSEILKMYPDVIEKIKSNLKSTVSEYGSLALSELGKKSCSMGACALAIQRFLEVPEVVLTLENTVVKK
ncbi:ROK family protein [Sporosarcina ureilytica]|uniref:ROK family protein n=1 Tax=Sporosarcina ureilytica TaxID=298596 RepID=A0A1D8JIU2_9BACL|nr:ROK family protein [Sporosarcina ureilytica]AOV08626.1 ROK family protein [Sporosarcina ureilytica]